MVSDFSPEMDEELQKRNTDCVYFLASPLTCKKGIECEYRHCEIARLNPRDCWYWLAGSCLNPSCGFRHPPLDARKDLSSETAPPQYQCAEPVNKVNVPCYFYFNGFCNKRDRCSFLHGPDDGTPALRSLKMVYAVSNGPSLENKTSTGNDLGFAPVESHPHPSEDTAKRLKEMETESKEDLCPSALRRVKDPNPSCISASVHEEAAAIRSDKILQGKGIIRSRSFLCTDQSSDGQADGHIEREDQLESSPGFDVLVDNRSENLEYEDDPEYLVASDRDGKELNGYFFEYGYEDSVDDDSAYPDARILYEQDGLTFHDQFDDGQNLDYVRRFPGCSREKMLDPVLPQKRTCMPVDLAIDGGREMDLRDHLRKRRVINGSQVICFSRSNCSRHIDRSQERSRRYGTLRLCGRSTVELNDKNLGSVSRNGTCLNSNNPQGWFRHSRSNRLRQARWRVKEKRQSKQQFHSSDVSRKPISKTKYTEDSAMFTGPKTLAQIKEEKRKLSGNGDTSGKLGRSNGTAQDEFQGPKPLTKLLEEKKKLDSVVAVNTEGC